MAPIMVPVDLSGYPHFVVFRGALGNRVLLADPGVRQSDHAGGEVRVSLAGLSGIRQGRFRCGPGRRHGTAGSAGGELPSTSFRFGRPMNGEPHARRPKSSQEVNSTGAGRPRTAAVVVLSAGLGCALASPPAAVHAAGDALPVAAPANGSPADQDRGAAARRRSPPSGPRRRRARPRPPAARRCRVSSRCRETAAIRWSHCWRAPALHRRHRGGTRTLATGAPRDEGRGRPGQRPRRRPHRTRSRRSRRERAGGARARRSTSSGTSWQARDQLIANLLQRVEQLERRIVLSASQLDQAVGGAGPVPLMRRPVPTAAPPAAAGAAARAADPVSRRPRSPFRWRRRSRL